MAKPCDSGADGGGSPENAPSGAHRAPQRGSGRASGSLQAPSDTSRLTRPQPPGRPRSPSTYVEQASQVVTPPGLECLAVRLWPSRSSLAARRYPSTEQVHAQPCSASYESQRATRPGGGWQRLYRRAARRSRSDTRLRHGRVRKRVANSPPVSGRVDGLTWKARRAENRRESWSTLHYRTAEPCPFHL